MQRLKEALTLVEVRTLDHVVVAGQETTSFAERGLLEPRGCTGGPIFYSLHQAY